MPIGTVIWFAAAMPPDGFIECNGQSTTPYPALAILVGSNVPDLRGEFIRGWDHGRGVNTGRLFASWESDGFKTHSHATQITFSGFNGTTVIPGTVAGIDSSTSGAYRTNFAYNNTTSSGGMETRGRNIALLPCIKY